MGLNKLTTNYNGDLRYELGEYTNIFIFMMWAPRKSGIPQTSSNVLLISTIEVSRVPNVLDNSIWFPVISRKLHALLHQDFLLLNFPVTLIPFLLLPGTRVLENLSWWFRLGEDTPTLRKNNSLDSGPDRQTQRLEDGNKSPGWYKQSCGAIYHTVMAIPTSNKKISPCFPLVHRKNRRTMP